MRSKITILLVFTLALMLIGTSLVMAQEDPQYGGTLHLSNNTDWDTIDPAYCSGFDAGAMAVKVFDGLVRFDYHSNEVVPCLAKDWEIKNDGLVWIFNLNKGVKFHHGRELTAHDVKYSFDRLFDPETASPGTWAFNMIKGTDAALDGEADGVSGVEVIDDYTVKFELDYPFGLFLKHLTLPYGLIVPQDEVEKWGKRFSDHAVGTGPFKLEKWDRNNKLILVANKEYFDGRPYVDKVEYRVIPETMTSFAEFEAGNLDFAGIPDAEWDRVMNSEKYEDYIHKMTELSTYYLALNSDFEPLDDPKVRKAIAMAIDRQTIIDTIRRGTDTLATSPLPPGLPGHEDYDPIPYDPEGAKELLAEAGYPDGFDIELWTTTNSTTVRIVGAIQAYLKQIGINAEVVKNEWGVFFSSVKEGDVPIYYLSWWADYADPYNFLEPLLSSEDSRINFEDPVIDQMLKEAARATSAEARVNICKKIVERQRELQPYVWLYHTTSFTIKQPWIKGEIWHQMYNADKLVTIWIDQDLK